MTEGPELLFFADDGSPRLRISQTYNGMLDQPDTTKETKDFIKDKVRSAIDLLRKGLRVVEVQCDLHHRVTGRDLRSQLHRAAQYRDVQRALLPESLPKIPGYEFYATYESAQAVGKLSEAEQRSVVLAIVRRELGVCALGALVITGLLLRAAFGSGGL